MNNITKKFNLSLYSEEQEKIANEIIDNHFKNLSYEDAVNLLDCVKDLLEIRSIIR